MTFLFLLNTLCIHVYVNQDLLKSEISFNCEMTNFISTNLYWHVFVPYFSPHNFNQLTHSENKNDHKVRRLNSDSRTVSFHGIQSCRPIHALFSLSYSRLIFIFLDFKNNFSIAIENTFVLGYSM